MVYINSTYTGSSVVNIQNKTKMEWYTIHKKIHRKPMDGIQKPLLKPKHCTNTDKISVHSYNNTSINNLVHTSTIIQ